MNLFLFFKGFLQTTADEFCFYYARKDGGLCFPDFPRKQIRGPASNYLDQMEEYDKVEEISRFIKIMVFNLRKQKTNKNKTLTNLMVSKVNRVFVHVHSNSLHMLFFLVVCFSKIILA